MKTKMLIARSGRKQVKLIPAGRFFHAQLWDEEELVEEREVCGTPSSSLSPHAALWLPDALVLMGESQLQP